MDANSVLIVDDDAVFRSLVSQLLNSRGLNLVEARSGKEASALVASGNPLLALVDFRLPEMDGISWITQIREAGRNFPIAFISGSWCDQKTFSRLRNLLKVSLILQKPIVPELFIQQIESLLPANLMLSTSSAASEPCRVEPAPSQSSQSGDENADAGLLSLLEPLKQLRSKLERQHNIAAVQAQYADELTEKWTQLANAVRLAREQSEQRMTLNDAVSLAHQLRGTAGSVGFKKTGEDAGKIEDLLNRLDPTDTLQEIIWTEIFRCLADGETALRETMQSAQKTDGQPEHFTAGKILLWGTEAQYKPLTVGLSTIYANEIEVDICESLAGLIQKARKNTYQGAIFDLSMDSQSRMFAAAAQLRDIPQHRALPFACFVPAGTQVEQKDMVYAGFSMVSQATPNQDNVAEICSTLLTLWQTRNPRILTVDDDRVLTQFIFTILTEEEMTVHSLNEPIKIIDAMEEFKPDLVLLDVMMPGLSGYDVCRLLRADEKWKDVAIVFLTSKSDQDGRAAAFSAGGDDFLSKPVLAKELTTRVRAQLDQARRRRGEGEADPLTGALDPTDFMREAQTMLELVEDQTMPLSLCLLSVDDYTQMSIVHGMYCAREAVWSLGKLIQLHFKAEDPRGKIGDEGFAIAFLNEDQGTIGKALEQLLDDYANTKISSDAMGSLKATFSAGVAQYPEDGTTFHQLLNVANQRLMSGRQRKSGAISYAGASN